MLSRLSLAVLFTVSLASAHLDSLYNPTAGLVFKTGDVMAINWTIGNNHNGIDVHLSTDDKTWSTLVEGLGKTATTYNWKIPAMTTTQRARIRICQLSGPQGCTDADSVSNPADGPLYTLVSGRFSIESTGGTTGLLPSKAGFAPQAGWNLGWTPASSWSASPAASSARGAFDLRGRNVGLLLKARSSPARP